MHDLPVVYRASFSPPETDLTVHVTGARAAHTGSLSLPLLRIDKGLCNTSESHLVLESQALRMVLLIPVLSGLLC